MHPAARLALVPLLLAGAACGGRDARSAGPALVALDSVLLAENDTVFLGKPSGFIATPDGRFVVSDLFTRRVVVFGRDGHVERVIGKRGKGPGELDAPSWLAMDGDSLLYVMDDADTRIEAFDPRTGEFRWGRRLPGRFSMLASYERGLLAGYADSARNASVAVITADTGSLPAMGPLPALLRGNPIVRGVFGAVELTAFHDTLVTAYEVSDHVYLSRVGGGVLDSIEVPVVRRRGSRPELLRKVSDPNSAMKAAYHLSMPGELARMSSGQLALVSFDWQWTASRVQGTGYVSLVDLARRRSCPDAPLPGPGDPIPRVAFRGDTLWALVQQVEAERPYTVLRAYRVDGARCQWLQG
jgi:hypothetical protein